MNVGFIHPTYPQGEGTGATHSASRIVFELADRGHDLTVYCRSRPPETASFDRSISIEPLDRSGYPYHSALQFDRALRERGSAFERHDVVHSYVMDAIPALGEVLGDADVGTVVTLNAYGAVCPKNDLRYMDREPCTSNGLAKCTACSLATSGGHDEDGRLYRSASRLGYLKLIRDGERVAGAIDGFHALSPHIEETYADFGFPRERFSVIPNLLDERFVRPHESEFEPPYELLYVGSLGEHKGVDVLVPILDRLRDRSADDYRLTIVGDGGLRSTLERKAAERGLSSDVTFTGWLPNEDLPAVFASHDCFVYPGRWDEPFGRVFLEALATGTPTVASDVGSVAEIVGEGGRTTDGTTDDFVATIRSVLEAADSADDGAAAISAAASEALDRYRAGTVLPQFEALYERAIRR